MGGFFPVDNLTVVGRAASGHESLVASTGRKPSLSPSSPREGKPWAQSVSPPRRGTGPRGCPPSRPRGSRTASPSGHSFPACWRPVPWGVGLRLRGEIRVPPPPPLGVGCSRLGEQRGRPTSLEGKSVRQTGDHLPWVTEPSGSVNRRHGSSPHKEWKENDR